MNEYEIYKLNASRFKEFNELRMSFQNAVMVIKSRLQHNSRYKSGNTIRTHSCNQNLFENSNSKLLEMYYFFDDTLDKNIVIVECCEILDNLKFVPKMTDPNEEGQFGTIEFIPIKSCSEEDIQIYKNGLGGIIEIIYG